MPAFAPVVPLAVAQKMQEDGIYGRYHLLLAHEVAANYDDYRDLFNQMHPSTVIMDNSVIELGHPIGITDMMDACSAIRGAGDGHLAHRVIVVLPDHQLDCDATIASTIEALHTWTDAFVKRGLPVDYMAVPQGDDINSWTRCLEKLAGMISIDWVGIPRNFREKLGGSRVQACQLASILRPTWHQHLLGFSDDLHDDLVTCAMSIGLQWNVRGIDSAVPIRIAMRDKKELSFSDQVHPPRGDWWENPGDYSATQDIVKKNMELIRLWVK